MNRRPLLWAAIVAMTSSACFERSASRSAKSTRAEFGVFFGGQVQERTKIPFESDRSKQTIGFRLTFPSPAPNGRRVEWQLDMPGDTLQVPDDRGRLGEGRVIRIGETMSRPGEVRFEQLLELTPTDPLGTWNVRILVDRQVVLDRPFIVVSN